MIIDMTISAMEQNLVKVKKKKHSKDWTCFSIDWGKIDIGSDTLRVVMTSCSLNGAEVQFGDGITTTGNDGGDTFNSNATFIANTTWVQRFWSNGSSLKID